MKIDYHNMAPGSNKLMFTLRYLMNIIRSWYFFHFKWPWVKPHGFVRVMKGTSFAHFDISLGHNVQFGEYCNIASPVVLGNYVLCAGRVCFVGKNDHMFAVPGEYIWDTKREFDGATIVGDDVWLGHGVTVVGPVKIGAGAVIAAGAVVTSDIPECEVWGGVPAKKIKDRFSSEADKRRHLEFLKANNTLNYKC